MKMMEMMQALMNSNTNHSIPMRTCAGCGQSFEQSSLVRLVISPENRIELDYMRSLGGRGAYLYPNRECFEKAGNRKGFSKSFKSSRFDYEPERLWGNLVKINRDRLKSDIHLAKKAGAVVSGGNNVEAGLKNNQFCMLVVADDAAENTLQSFSNKATSHGLSVVQVLTMEELGHILGKHPRAVVGISDPAFATKIQRDSTVYDAVLNRSRCQQKR